MGRRVKHLPRWMIWRFRVEYCVFRLLAFLPTLLSTRQTIWLARMAATIVTKLVPRKMSRYKIARENLLTAFGDQLSDEEIDRTIFEMWVHLFRLVSEMLQLPKRLSLRNATKVFTFKKRDEMIRALCCDRPVILLGGHFGNWEMSIAAFGLFGFPMTVIARPLDNPYLDSWFERYREHTGHKLLAKRGALNKLAAVLDDGRHAAMLADQDAGSQGVFVDFFGKPASTFPSIARLAIACDAILVLGYSRRLPDQFRREAWVQFELGAEDFIDPRDYAHLEMNDRVYQITERYTQALERAVRLAPEQYFWLHRRWKTSTERQKARRRKAS